MILYTILKTLKIIWLWLISKTLISFYIILALLLKNLVYINDYKNMMKTFQKIDVVLKLKPHKQLYTIVLFVIFHLFYVCDWIFTYKNQTILNIIIEVWLVYISMMDTIVAHNILYAIRRRLKNINECVLKLHETATNINVSTLTVKKNSSHIPMLDDNKIMELIEVHTRIVRLIHIFNKLYGPIIFILNSIFVIYFLSIVLRIVTPDMDSGEIYFDLWYAASYVVSI